MATDLTSLTYIRRGGKEVWLRALRQLFPSGLLWNWPLYAESNIDPSGISSSESFGTILIIKDEIVLPIGIATAFQSGTLIVSKWSEIIDYFVNGIRDQWWNNQFLLAFPLVNYGEVGWGSFMNYSGVENMRWLTPALSPISGDFILDCGLMFRDTYTPGDTWAALEIQDATKNTGTGYPLNTDTLVEVHFVESLGAETNTFNIEIDGADVEHSPVVTFVAYKILHLRIKRIAGVISGAYKDGDSADWTYFSLTKTYSNNVAVVINGNEHLAVKYFNLRAASGFPY